jgi:hypothetical protein
MDNLAIVRSKEMRTLLIANLIFSILVGFTILSFIGLIYKSDIIAEIVSKLLLPLMIAAPVFMVWNIIAIRKCDRRDRSKLIGYTTISVISTFLAIIAVIFALSWHD